MVIMTDPPGGKASQKKRFETETQLDMMPIGVGAKVTITPSCIFCMENR